jgi:hypothetical protein
MQVAKVRLVIGAGFRAGRYRVTCLFPNRFRVADDLASRRILKPGLRPFNRAGNGFRE